MLNAYRFTLSLSFIALVAVAALADEAPDPKPQPKPEPKAEGNKAPWTAKEVHDSWLKGKVFNYDVETEDGKGSKGRFEIDNVTDADFTMTQSIQEAGKEEQIDKPRKRQFEEYVGGLERQIKDAVKGSASYSTPDGVTLECSLFTLESKGAWQKFWLSPEVPGVPVKMERETMRAEKRDYECWTLTSHDILRLPLSWTAKDLMAAWKDGAWFKYSLSAEGQSSWMTFTFSEVNEEGFTSTEQMVSGRDTSPEKTRKYTWGEFMRIAPPKHGTTVSKETIEIKAGKFECTLYTIVDNRDGVESTDRYWFAKELVGIQVKWQRDYKSGDKTGSTVFELMEYKIGK